MSSESYYIGVDVGTGSVRAGLVKKDGTLLSSSTQNITTYRDEHDHRIFEQSTTEIWSAICTTIRSILSSAKISPLDVKGLGFDATCSLAVADERGEPVCVTKGEGLGKRGERNVILWADHRAEKEAEVINKSGSVVLDYVGGTMSLEMEVPKTLWLKTHMPPSLFPKCHFFDLPDYLTYRATSLPTRSCCSLICKCSYVPAKGGWQDEFFSKIGLGEFGEEEYRQMGAGKGEEVLNAGLPVGKGLSKRAAEELGLVEGTPVGSGVIDAYAGWLGTIAARYTQNGQLSPIVPSLDESRHRLAAVAGTSTCYVVQSPEGVFVDGVWGPYRDVLFPGWWCNEGGQSSTGQLIDFMITTHPAYPKLVERAEKERTNIHQVLHEILQKLCRENGVESATELTKDMHFYPDLHGNRSPIADPKMRGSIMGLALDSSLTDLSKKFSLTLESIALQTRHIIDTLNTSGHSISSIYMSGGQARNGPLMQLLANVCRMSVVLPKEVETAVVRGSAMLARFAHEVGSEGGEGGGERLWNVMVEMTPAGTMVAPNASEKEKRLLEAKYKIFRESIEIQKRWREEMEVAAAVGS
ncbi:hypothetical protein JAAARDRAFT_28723 [Jaapia argillacea MUCL 33604]|uniref:Carbohydrate kinase FGGY C-terminal domain-containing protein n=1 Tax=Jaapia argillacea MUCL 33604 TaxID=933084 RepID=A0A067QFV2_9AGAM|nr:hypothetical protein JAAARDRAFT_28723 [Jaapia argillacea MUCL 33604]